VEEVRRVERQEKLVRVYMIERVCCSNRWTWLIGWCCRWRWLRRFGGEGEGWG
jgi:hypothetical protein